MAAKKKAEKKPVKKKVKSRTKDTPKDISKRIIDMSKGIAGEINKHKDPTFTTMQRGKSNVEFNQKKGILELGDKRTTRQFLNIGHAKKFMQTMMVASKTNDYLEHNKTAAIREIYYELKHTVGKTKENTFDDQTESDGCIVDLEHSVDTIREKLNLHANPKGTLYGDITLRDKMHHNDEFNASKLGRGGWSVMSRIEPEEIEFIKVNAKYVLMIETEAMYERLVEEGFPRDNKCILVSTGGQAARGTRRLIARLHQEEGLPVYCFTDGDPYGWYIYSVVKQGSMALAAHSEFMACPDAKYIGMTLEDIDEYDLQNVTEHMKEGDIKRAKEMLDYPWFQTEGWQNELKKAIKDKVRIEQQALANKSLSFVAEEYLPKKIKKKDFLS